MLFKYGFEKLPKENQKKINNIYLDFQKQYGSREDMEDLVLQRKRQHLED